MEKRRKLLYGTVAAIAMIVIILDAKTAYSGALEGIQLCINTVMPSLFPYFLLSGLINSCLFGRSIGILKQLRRFCRIPEKSESLLLLGFLAGYPVGAQLIAQEYSDGRLSRSDAERMLGFCSNAGPAFFFGILAPIFNEFYILICLWTIHILSALVAARLIPSTGFGACSIRPATVMTLSASLKRAIPNMALVCGWIVIFRIVLSFCSRWFLWLLPPEIQVLFSGFVELSNGCVSLLQIPSESTRFVLASILLASGGACIAMQTVSVTQTLGSGYYFPGKVIQASASAIISHMILPLLYPDAAILSAQYPVILIAISVILVTSFLMRRKKVVAFGRRMLYNTGN